MKVLIHKDLILGFIKQNLKDKEQQLQINQIFNNKNLVFLFSKNFFSFIEKEIEEKYREEFIYLVNKLRDGKFDEFTPKINTSKTSIDFEDEFDGKVNTSGKSKTFEEEFIEIFNTATNNVVLALSLNTPSPAIKQAIPQIAIFTQQKKPNYHWLVVNLAICSPFTLSVDEADFKNDTQTDKFFDDLFSIPKKIESATIFDDFQVFKDKKYFMLKNSNVSYCTRLKGKPENIETLNTQLKLLKIEFSESSLWRKDEGSHTRRIVFEGFVVNPDIAINQAKVSTNKIWSIHIRFGEELAKTMLAIRDKEYQEYKPNL